MIITAAIVAVSIINIRQVHQQKIIINNTKTTVPIINVLRLQHLFIVLKHVILRLLVVVHMIQLLALVNVFVLLMDTKMETQQLHVHVHMDIHIVLVDVNSIIVVVHPPHISVLGQEGHVLDHLHIFRFILNIT